VYLKILHVIDSGGLYGAEIMLLNLVAEQVSMGLEPVIASIGDPHVDEKPLETEALRRGLRVEKFRMRPGPNILGAINVLRFAWREKCDVLHSHGYKPNILFGFLPRKLRRLPMLTTLHGWTWTGGLNRMGIYEYLDRLSLRFIDAVVLVNDTMRKKLSIPRSYVVNNGISLAEKIHEQQASLDTRIVSFCRGGHTFGAIGRLSPEKGFGILLKALHELAKTNPEVRLIILGEGGERGSLEAQVRALGLEDRVLMPGYVENAKRYLSLFRGFVLSSFTEGLPMVILEAMQAGVPIVATRVGGVPAVLENGTAGLLIEPYSTEDLSENMRSLVEDECLASRLAECGKNLVSTKYPASKMAVKYLEIYGLLQHGHTLKVSIDELENK
jgi:glycosyltransferase involved in cell wall biosynthesis